MIVTVRQGGDPDRVRRALVERGLWAKRLEGAGRVQFVVAAHSAQVPADGLGDLPDVELVTTSASAHPLVDAMPEVLEVGPVRLGPGQVPVVFAGPCAVESEEQVRRLAASLAAMGVRFLRGGAFKPRTSPYEFQGKGQEALRWLKRAATENGMGLVTECMGVDERDDVAEHADLVQIGSRNMHNYALLKSVAKAGRPVFLKRGMAATVEEWLAAGEYCLLHGAPSVVFCERGIRSFDPSTRNLVDLGAVALLAHVHRVPVVVDPSHGTGRRDLVMPLARAAVAAGAHGVMVETHDDPGSALSDGPQAMLPDQLAALVRALGVSP
ncbi:MAG: 3-deoxy-7-phosphoheptulonate synthase [Deltaproteobacteria bacterium]|nr:3-deoxy-7-phosphoheptulonate synthase [Deltaproteobacteria bacterium]